MLVPRQQYSRELKIAAMREIDSGKGIAEVARMYQLSLKRLETWKGEWRAKGELAFPGKSARPQTRLDAERIAELERKIGQQAMAIDFLKKVKRHLVCKRWTIEKADENSNGIPWFVLHRPNSDKLRFRNQIQRIALRWPAYGYRRVHAELLRQGWSVNHKRILRLMRADNLLCLRRRKFLLLTTDSQHGLPIYPNVAEEMLLTSIDQLWVADITYIRLQVEFVYLAVLLDAFSRRCIGWALRRSLECPKTRT